MWNAIFQLLLIKNAGGVGGWFFFNLKVIPGYSKRSTNGFALENDEHVKTRRL